MLHKTSREPLCKGCYRALLLVAAVAICGCGGVTDYAFAPDRGEGSIPVGRAMAAMRISVVDEGGGVQEVKTRGDTFFLKRMTKGTAQMSFHPVDPRLQPASFKVIVGENQRYIVNVVAQPKSRQRDVDGLSLSLDHHGPIPIGTRLQIQATVQGSNVEGLEPTVWVDGGVGTLSSSNEFLATHAGNGLIRARIFGQRASIRIVVREGPN
jgi:hypothetical protein